eukprot:TRINITY_DN2633_c0_g1_i2.p1 TRINITY_DN2633_c0_g1~~TRINITY_DN2633_c0_g1_i2.p1  ORF type:complete len:386 (+),score=36.49 TRINITY_DN2633_c0_g1_i2:725-1882(+)
MLGTENILLAVAMHFKCLIHVDDDKYDKLSAIDGMDNVLTTDPTNTRFHACRANALAAMVPKRQAISATKSGTGRANSKDRLQRKPTDSVVRYHHKIFGNHRVEQEMLKDGPALFIKPSSQWFGSITDEKVKLTGKASPISHLVDGIWHVLSSIHSSSTEIHQFVEKLKPQRLVPLVECTDVSLKSLMKFCRPDPQRISRPAIPTSIEMALESTEPRISDGKRGAAAQGELSSKRAKLEEDSSALTSIFENSRYPGSPLPPESRESSDGDGEDNDEIQIHEETDSPKAMFSKTPNGYISSTEAILDLEGASQMLVDGDEDLLHISHASGNTALRAPLIDKKGFASQDILNVTLDQGADVEPSAYSAEDQRAPKRSLSLIYDDLSD